MQSSAVSSSPRSRAITWGKRALSCSPAQALCLLALVASLLQGVQAQVNTTQAVLATGANEYGQLGDGTTTDKNLAVEVTGKGALSGKTITQISVGFGHNLALCSDGTVAAWGYNVDGQLGDGTTTNRLLPVNISGKGALASKTVTRLVAGFGHSVALCSDGTVATWGRNNDGALGDDTTTSRSLPVDITGNGVLSGKRVTQIAAGDRHTLALCSDGTLALWGLDTATYSLHTTPIDITGRGDLNGKTVTQIAVGTSHSFALCSDGSAIAWGRNSDGDLGVGYSGDVPYPVDMTTQGALNGKRVVQIAAGFGHSVALCSDGTVAVSGDNIAGQLGDGTTVSKNLFTPINDKGALNGKTVLRIAAGASHGLAVCSDGTLVGWGRNGVGQLGDGTTVNRLLPVAVTGKGAFSGKKVTEVAAGWGHTLALATTPLLQAPVIRVNTPTMGQKLALSQFNGNTISGTASDNIGVTRVTIKLSRVRNGVTTIWNGRAFTTASTAVPAERSSSGTSITWKMGVKAPPVSQLDAGDYSIIAFGYDASGNRGVARGRFTLLPANALKPSISITKPSENQSILLSQWSGSSIGGNASDDVAVANVRLKLLRTRNGVTTAWNGTAFTTTSSTVFATLSGSGANVTWTMGAKAPPLSQLDAGVYTLYAYATDTARQITGTPVRTFTLTSGASSSAPAATSSAGGA